jgi:hypothetical protein
MSITGVVPPVEVILFAVPDTLVTVPLVAGGAHVGTPPANVNTFVFEPAVSFASVFTPEAYSISPVAHVDCPVPPKIELTGVPFHTPVVIVPRVVSDVCPTYVAAISI